MSYRLWLFSFYKLYKDAWIARSDWPQGWAVISSSFAFAMLVVSVEFWLHSFGYETITFGKSVEFIPDALRQCWSLLFFCVFNGYYLLVPKNLEYLLCEVSTISDKARFKGYLATGLICFLILSFFFITIYLFQ